MLTISNLTVTVENKIIINNLNLSVTSGTVHAIMGPNGSGKSSLSAVIMGHPDYTVTHGEILYNGINVLTLSPDKRARLGIFLAFQQPPAMSIRVFTFLHEAYAAVHGKTIAAPEFQLLLNEYMQRVGMDPSFAYRNLNEGFSGGERKRLELLQLLVLQPKLIILDEIDSGLDIDALLRVAHVVQEVRKERPETAFIIITHYQRILQHITPDYVHVLHAGALVDSGTMSLVTALERTGYAYYTKESTHEI